MARPFSRPAFIATIALIATGTQQQALAMDALNALECYDTEVSARILSQTPTRALDCGNDCIITSWPWLIDLKVTRVHSGDIRRESLTVLAVLHTDFSRKHITRRLKLRRNTQGGFNLLRGDAIPRCPPQSPPAIPYITPPDGQTFDDLRREGQQYYGRDT